MCFLEEMLQNFLNISYEKQLEEEQLQSEMIPEEWALLKPSYNQRNADIISQTIRAQRQNGFCGKCASW